MNWILGLLFILIILFLYHNYAKKKKLAILKKWFIKNWGKPKSTDYFNFYVIGKYFKNNEHKNQAFHIISEKVEIDLDINELFKFIDRTSSKIGQQYLYFKLRTIGSFESLLKFDVLSNLFLNNENLRLKSQLSLSKINTPNSYDLEKLITDKPIEKPTYLIYIYASSLLSVLLVILTFFNPVFSLFLLPIFFINTIFHYKNKENVTYYTNAVYQLSKALKVSKELSLFKEIKSHFSDLSFIKKVSKIQTKTEFIEFEKLLSNEYALIFWFIIELIKIQFMVEYILFFSFIDSIVKEKDNIEKMFCFIGEIDSAISTASIKAGENKICTPNFTKEKHLNLTDIYHPLIEKCITNNINLIDKSMLLTGSNMSGKTTFIRTVAINSILAQTLNICFAKKYTAPFYKVYSSIRITDDLLDNTSYYLEEVLTVKELIDASKNEENCLFVLDEIFKGTNTIERISAGKAILSYLNKKNHTVLVSTHDIELTDLLVKENYELFHFSELIENEKLFFDHKLKEGKLKTRNAIKILELYKYPPEIIVDARKTEKNNFS